ncbi:MAG: hypothetical protein ACLFQ7_07720 [Phormidium sp.]
MAQIAIAPSLNYDAIAITPITRSRSPKLVRNLTDYLRIDHPAKG